MGKSRVSGLIRQVLPGSAAVAALVCAFGLVSPAHAGSVTLCPSQAGAAGNNATFTNVVGPLDGTCGANSAVQISLGHSTDYGRLAFDSSTPGYPTSLTLGGLLGASANVSFTSGGTDQPFFMLAFTDSSDSLGQGSATDQILMIEFQPATVSGVTMALDPNATLFNLFDNTTGVYLQTGQQDTKTVDGWLADFASLGGESLQQIRTGLGLAGGDTGPESLTVNSLTVTTADVAAPEPASLTLLGVALAGLGYSRRRRATRAA